MLKLSGSLTGEQNCSAKLTLSKSKLVIPLKLYWVSRFRFLIILILFQSSVEVISSSKVQSTAERLQAICF